MLPVGCLLEVSVISSQEEGGREREREEGRWWKRIAIGQRGATTRCGYLYPLRILRKNHVDRDFGSSILTTISGLHENPGKIFPSSLLRSVLHPNGGMLTDARKCIVDLPYLNHLRKKSIRIPDFIRWKNFAYLQKRFDFRKIDYLLA